MPKIVIESGMVLNLGGFVVEKKAKLACLDVVVGNPLREDVKVDAPIYSQEMVDDIAKAGLIVEPLMDGESLKDKLGQVRKRVDEALSKA
jgi:hypothetical protein